MELFETCTDDGRKSVLLTEKLTCRICGNIKPVYSVTELEEPNVSNDSKQEGKYEIPFCRCDQETCFQWFKRIIGLGPGKRECDISFQRGCEVTDAASIKLQKGTDRCTKLYKEEDCLFYDKFLDSAGFTFSEKPSSYQLETERQSNVPKELQGKKSKKSKTGGTQIRSSPVHEPTKSPNIKEICGDNIYPPASCATVFHSYRSRALYTLQPGLLHMTLEERKLAKRLQRKENTKRRNTRLSSVTEASANNTNINWSACHTEEIVTDLKDNYYDNFVGFSRPELKTNRKHQEKLISAIVPHIFSFPTTAGHLMQLRYPSSRISCFSSSACELRPHGFNAETMKVPLGTSGEVPCPTVLSSASPIFQNTSQNQKRKIATPKMSQKQSNSLGFLSRQPGVKDNINLSLIHRHLKGSQFTTKLASSKALESEVNTFQGRGRHRDTDRLGPNIFRRKAHTRSGSSPPHTRFCGPQQILNPRTMYCSMPLSQNRREHSKQKKVAPKLWNTIKSCNTNPRQHEDCPVDRIGTSVSLSPPIRKPKPVTFKETQQGPQRFRSTSSTAEFNFSQSSNNGTGPETKMCSECRLPVKTSSPPRNKICKCEITLAPTCVRRGGPRSTVREYLSTIDHPKPRFKPPVFASRQPKEPESQQAETEAVASTKKGGAASKKKKKMKIKSEEKGEAEDKGQIKASAEEGDSSAAAAAQKAVDGNNNYGLKGSAPQKCPPNTSHSASTGSNRVSRIPSYYHTSFLDSSYSQVHSSPYSTSYELRASQKKSAYVPSIGFSYLRAAQELRKGIRDNYKQRQVLSDSASYPWRTSSTDMQISLFKAWSPTVRLNKHTLSPEKTNQRKIQIRPTRSMEYRKTSDPKFETRSVGKKCTKTRPKSLPQIPQLKESLPQFFPKKSFLEGKIPKFLINQETKKGENKLNKNASKPQLHETVGFETQNVEKIKHVKGQKTKRENLPHKASDTFPCEKMKSGSIVALVSQENKSSKTHEKQEDEISETNEKQENEISKANEKQEDKTSKASEKQEDKISKANEKQEQDANRCGDSQNIQTSILTVNNDVTEYEHGVSTKGKRPDGLLQMRVTAILHGKESSVDYGDYCKDLPSTVRKIEPWGAVIKLTSEKEPTQCGGISTVPQASGEQHSVTQQSHRKKEKKEGKGEISGRAAVEQVELSDALTENSKLQAGQDADFDSLKESTGNMAAWGLENQTRNKAEQSCETTSQFCSGVTMQTHPESAGSSSVEEAQGNLAPSLKAARGDASTLPTAQNYAVKVEIFNSHDALPNAGKPADYPLATFKEVILDKDQGTPLDQFGLTKILPKGTHMIKPNPKVISGAGETWQIENTKSGNLDLPPPSKSYSGAATIRACIETVPMNITQPDSHSDKLETGSSVDPTLPAVVEDLKRDILQATAGKQLIFEKVKPGACNGAMCKAAKSIFLPNPKLRGKSMTNLSAKVPPTVISSEQLVAVVCKSLDNTCALPVGPVKPGDPVRLVALTEAMKRFISFHGTPV